MLGSSQLVAFVATTDIDRALVFYRDTLGAAGVRFERFEGTDQDGIGVWTAPNGAQVARCPVARVADPDGTVPSLTQSEALSGGAS